MQKILHYLGYGPNTSGVPRTPAAHQAPSDQVALRLSALWSTCKKHFSMGDNQGLGIGGGLVEIAALTALIGGSTAESLALGTRGACGLPWAALSSFGSIFIVKACVSACTPAWLRETIGVRTAGSDAAVGCNLSLDRQSRGRRLGAEAVGVEVQCDKNSKERDISWTAFEDVYAFDEWVAGPLRSCAATEPGQQLRAHFYVRDPQWALLHKSLVKMDWIYSLATMVKIVEVYLLWYYGSTNIFWITGVAWAYFFISSVVLQLFQLGRATRSGKQDRCIDVVAGNLPTAQVIGGDRKVLLDVPINARKHALWQAIWTGGSLICVCSLIGTYALLSKEPTICFQIWLLFQIIWLALRSLFFHFAHETDDMARVITPLIDEKHQPLQVNYRLLGLSTALSRYQVRNHPRGAYCYADDAHDPTIIKGLLDEGGLEFLHNFPLWDQEDVGSTMELTVAAVLGDTLLGSVAWLMGSSMTGMDLYDSCILVLRFPNEKTLLVPACRVLSGRIEQEHNADPESTMPSGFMPKGVSNTGNDISWWYWIPCGDDKWLHYHTPWTTPARQQLGIAGKRDMIVVSGKDITEMLGRGELLISMNSVGDVENVIKQSVAAAAILREMMLGKPGRVGKS